MIKWIVEMPDGFKPDVCGLCSMLHACHANNGIGIDCIKRCPLSSAVIAYEVTGNHLQEYVGGRPVKLYATMEDK